MKKVGRCVVCSKKVLRRCHGGCGQPICMEHSVDYAGKRWCQECSDTDRTHQEAGATPRAPAPQAPAVRMNPLHVYPQFLWHQDVVMVGTKASLEALRQAIDVALLEGAEACEFTVTDGEGFRVVVVRNDDEKAWDRLAVPYADKDAQERRKEAIGYYQLPEWKKLRLKTEAQRFLKRAVQKLGETLK